MSRSIMEKSILLEAVQKVQDDLIKIIQYSLAIILSVNN